MEPATSDKDIAVGSIDGDGVFFIFGFSTILTRRHEGAEQGVDDERLRGGAECEDGY
jgi:hypothetical protein